MTAVRNISGQRFGFLVAQSRLDGYKKARWRCLCDCGLTTVVPLSNLCSGNTRSCGCQKYKNRKTGRITIREIPEYKTWDSMRQRCTNPNAPSYSRYGGRGIKVCERWMLSFKNFLSDMGPRPSKEHSIDRKDNDGPYSPENCRWATIKEQMRNTSINVNLTAFGKTQILVDWAREVGMNQQTIAARLSAGWPIEAALTAPKKKGPRKDIERLSC